jgi:hypothetical protein
MNKIPHRTRRRRAGPALSLYLRRRCPAWSRPLPPAPPAATSSRRWTRRLRAGPRVIRLPPPPGHRPGLRRRCLALRDRPPAPPQPAGSRIGPPRPRAPLQRIGPMIGNWGGEIRGAVSSVGGGGALGARRGRGRRARWVAGEASSVGGGGALGARKRAASLVGGRGRRAR